MIIELKGYANATRATLSRVTALIIVLAIMCAGTAFAASPSTYNVTFMTARKLQEFRLSNQIRRLSSIKQESLPQMMMS